MAFKIIFVLSALVVESWCSTPKTYQVRLESLSILPTGDYILANSNLRIMGRERSFNGTVALLEDMDNDHFELSVDTYSDSSGSGEYKKLPYTMPKTPACKLFEEYVAPYSKDTLKYNVNTDFPFEGNQCPIPKGIYYFKNIIINTDGWPQVMPIGYFKGIVSIYKDDEIVTTINYVVNIEKRGF